jgi:hypothetical protein
MTNVSETLQRLNLPDDTQSENNPQRLYLKYILTTRFQLGVFKTTYQIINEVENNITNFMCNNSSHSSSIFIISHKIRSTIGNNIQNSILELLTTSGIRYLEQMILNDGSRPFAGLSDQVFKSKYTLEEKIKLLQYFINEHSYPFEDVYELVKQLNLDDFNKYKTITQYMDTPVNSPLLVQYPEKASITTAITVGNIIARLHWALGLYPSWVKVLQMVLLKDQQFTLNMYLESLHGIMVKSRTCRNVRKYSPLLLPTYLVGESYTRCGKIFPQKQKKCGKQLTYYHQRQQFYWKELCTFKEECYKMMEEKEKTNHVFKILNRSGMSLEELEQLVMVNRKPLSSTSTPTLSTTTTTTPTIPTTSTTTTTIPTTLTTLTPIITTTTTNISSRKRTYKEMN